VRFDGALAWLLLAVELVLCLSLLGPQPLGWMWIGSQMEYMTGAVTAGIATIMLGTLASLMLTMVLAKRVDYWWKLARRAGGHHQERGALERIFVLACGIAIVGSAIWFFLIQGPAPSLAPTN
jgi:predicted signal transduction protein with EAL and GGDEF domain